MNKVSLVFPAFNRLEYTKQAWAALMANTDWSLVEEFHVYDDGSTDGTCQWLEEQFGRTFCSQGAQVLSHVPVSYFRETRFNSPMGVTIDWIKRTAQRARAPLLAKLDNDTIYPPGWLNIALNVMERHPELDMLGLECMRKPVHFDRIDLAPVAFSAVASSVRKHLDLYAAQFDFLPAVYISGLGIYKRSAFAAGLPEDGGYFGLEEFQQARSHLKYGWILPSLPVFLLDRMPTEPWRSLSEEYVKKGWQRKWSLDLRYKPEQSAMWEWWRPVE